MSGNYIPQGSTPVERIQWGIAQRQAARAAANSDPNFDLAGAIIGINDAVQRANGVRAMPGTSYPAAWNAYGDPGVMPGVLTNASAPSGNTPATAPASPYQPNLPCPPGQVEMTPGVCIPENQATPNAPGQLGGSVGNGLRTALPGIGDWIAQYFVRAIVILIGIVLLGSGIALFGRQAISSAENVVKKG